MTNTVLIKRSSTANAVPSAGNLQAGELAINYNDGNLFYKNTSNVVTVIASNQFVSVSGNVVGANVVTGNISATGNINFTTSSNVSLGSVGNVHILGGSPGYVLTTDGLGNLSWALPVTDLSIVVNNFVGDGSTTQFPLTITPPNINSTIVNYNGIVQFTTSYTLSGSNLIFSAPPDNGSQIEVTIIQAGGGVNVANITGDGSTTQFPLGTTPTDINDTIVNYNGVIQLRSSYAVNSSNIIFSTAPEAGVPVEIIVLDTNSSTLSDVFTGDGSTTQFALSAIPNGINSTFVNYNGVVQLRNGYSIVGSDIIFSSPPAAGSQIEVTIISTIPTSNAAGINTQVQFNDNGVLGASSAFTFDKISETVSVGAVAGSRTNVTITTSTTIDTFTTGTYRGAKYLIQGNNGIDYQSCDVLLVHNNVDAFITISTVCSNLISDVFSVNAVVNSGNVTLRATKIASGTVTVNLTPVYVKD